MGNCLVDGGGGQQQQQQQQQQLQQQKKNQNGDATKVANVAELKELRYLDSLRGQHPPGSFPPDASDYLGYREASIGYAHSVMPMSVGYNGYGLQPPPRYPSDYMGRYYQPMSPMLYMDPYTGTTYEYQQVPYDQDIYDMYMENERKYRQRQERRRSKHHDDHNNNDNDGNNNDDDNNKDNKEDGGQDEKEEKRKHHRQRSSGRKGKEDWVPIARSSAKGEIITTTAVINVTSSQTRHRPDNYRPADVMISYCKKDLELMKKIQEHLESKGVSVWVETASKDKHVDVVRPGEAIIDAKVVIIIVGEDTAKSRHCRDEVALAFLTNTIIYPVNVVPQEHGLFNLDPVMNLLLSGYKWTSLADPATADDNINNLATSIKGELNDLNVTPEAAPLPPPPPPPPPPPESEAGTSEAADGGDVTVTSPADVEVGVDGGEDAMPVPLADLPPPPPPRDLRERNRVVVTEKSEVTPDQFWANRFGVADFVNWDRFSQGFVDEFQQPVDQMMTSEQRQQLFDVIKRRLDVDKQDMVFTHKLTAFCTYEDRVLPVWQRVEDQAKETTAVRQVFSMNSGVRIAAVDSFGQFRSESIEESLRDLLHDLDPNARAVATMSLARADVRDHVTLRHILEMLNDKDRLVREAACMALGHLKAREAISKLTYLWRNDVIAQVRDAAVTALRQIGGPEVEDAVRVTKVLSKELQRMSDMHF